MSDFLEAALAREGHDFYRGSPDFDDEEVPDDQTVMVGRRVGDPVLKDRRAEVQPGREQTDEAAGETGDSTTHGDSGPSATPSPDDDEPRGSGRDPFGRPDPRTHPEYWCE